MLGPPARAAGACTADTDPAAGACIVAPGSIAITRAMQPNISFRRSGLVSMAAKYRELCETLSWSSRVLSKMSRSADQRGS